jgi:chromosomal replication initiator protein
LDLADFIVVPENEAARRAVEHVLDRSATETAARQWNPLFIQGRTGSGKSHLVSALVKEFTYRFPESIARYSTVDELLADLASQFESQTSDLDACDLLVVEDLQRLRPTRPSEWLSERLAQTFDQLLRRNCQLVFTADVGPAHLSSFTARLRDRVGAGLVVGIDPPGLSSRLKILEEKARRKQLPLPAEILAWLAERLTGGVRQLKGAIAKLTLLKKQVGRLDLPTVARHFREESTATEPTLDAVSTCVSKRYEVSAGDLRSRRRSQKVVLPRQVAIYLARELTGLAFDRIGAYFGGRDHSTALYAFQKVQQGIKGDLELAGTVKAIRSELT